MTVLQLTTPDDWHLHFRDGDMLQETVPATARCFRRAVVMPNLVPPVTTGALASAYRERILAARPAGSNFEPVMTIYLTDTTTAQDIADAKAAGVLAAKLYPAGAPTNSHSGVSSLSKLYPVLEAMLNRTCCSWCMAKSPTTMSTSLTAKQCLSSSTCAKSSPVSRIYV